MKLKKIGNVTAPGQSTALTLYVIDRGRGREAVHTAYIERVIEEYIDRGIITPYPVPDDIQDSALPYHPELWGKPAASVA